MKSTRPVLQPVKVRLSVPQGLFTILVGSKFGIQRPPVVKATPGIAAVFPEYVPTPPNQDCCVPSGEKANHQASSLLSGKTSRKIPCPLCCGSYQRPVMPGPIANVDAP